MTTTLPLDGWRRRSQFLEKHPHLLVLVPTVTSLDWILRSTSQRDGPVPASCRP